MITLARLWSPRSVPSGADLRKGTTTDHTNDLSDTDMTIIYTGYRCSLRACYESLEGFQNAQVPDPRGSPDDFSAFLDLYKKKR
jgi:hypothetical protein